MQVTDHISQRRFRVACIVIVILAAAWRLAMAAAMPAISRDGITFCHIARNLGTQGIATLRDPDTHQHPLFPVTILATQRCMHAVGWTESPWTWQRAGQAVNLVAGLVVVVLIGVLTSRILQQIEPDRDRRGPVLLAMLMAGVLPLGVWLSADVLAESLHLACYLGAVIMLLRLRHTWMALVCGLLGGLAFLTRQEGFVPVFAAILLIVQRADIPTRRQALASGVAVLMGFAICAVPYWTIVGKFSPKKDPLDLVPAWMQERSSPAPTAWTARPSTSSRDFADATRTLTPDRPPDRSFVHARLETHDPTWWSVAPHVFYKLLRAGRVVIPLLAIPTLGAWLYRERRPALLGLTYCIVGHSVLCAAVLERHGYLATRHLYVAVALLIPAAAAGLAYLCAQLAARSARWLGVAALVGALAPLALYATRIPNGADAFLAQAAKRLVAIEGDVSGERMLCGASPRRVAFYAEMRWVPWWEDADKAGILARSITSVSADYFAIELESPRPGIDQYERAGNRALLDKVLSRPGVASALRHVLDQEAPDGGVLRIYRIDTRAAPRGIHSDVSP